MTVGCALLLFTALVGQTPSARPATGASAPASTIRLAAPGFAYVSVEEKVADFFTDYFSQQLLQHGPFRVTTKGEIATLLGFERQKELLGCNDQGASCLAELSGALGVDGLITGSIAKLGSSYTINIKIVAARDGRQLGAASGRLANDDAMLDWLSATARKLARDVLHDLKPGTELTAEPHTLALEPAPMTARSIAWVPMATGAALAVTGGIFYGLAVSATDLESAQLGNRLEVDAQLARGKFYEQLAWGLAIGGLVTAGVGGVLWLLPSEPAKPRLTLSVAVTPAGVSIQGVLP